MHPDLLRVVRQLELAKLLELVLSLVAILVIITLACLVAVLLYVSVLHALKDSRLVFLYAGRLIHWEVTHQV